MSSKPIELLHITDTHLFDDASALLLNMNTRLSFAAVMDQICQQRTRFDAVLATGDIAQDASVGAYRHFLRQIGRLGAPCYWTPGNHDRRKVMQSIEGIDQQWPFRVLLDGWQVILLDSTVSGQVYGRLGAEQLAILDDWLSEAEASSVGPRHALVCLHHNPAPGSAEWMHGIGLRDADTLLTLLGRHPGVRAVLHGHIHQQFDMQYRGLRILCTPSTCIQFKPGVTDFTLDEQGPAWRWLRLHHNGELESGVKRVNDFVLSLDHDAGGY